MENIGLLMHGFTLAFSASNLLAALFGAIVGLIVGAMPGLGGITGVSLLLPLTYSMSPTTAIIMLASLYYSTMYGGSFSAILLNIPGDSPAVMTALDGNQLTRKGQPGRALAAANISSFIGGTIGIILLTISGPILARFGLKFGSPELALLIIFAMTSIGWILGDNPVKGLLATGLGLMLATVGVDQAVGLSRFSFGTINLLSGISFIPMVIGIFGFSQVIEMAMLPARNSDEKVQISRKDCYLSKSEMKRILPITLRQGILGTFIGVMPGAGATTSAFLSYIMEKRINKNRDEMGKGCIEGVSAPESSNNAAAAGAFAPLLTLGIPGGSTTAVLLGGLMMWGLRPGPTLFTDNPDFVWPLIASMYLGNIICLLIAFLCIPLLVKAIKVPNAILIPVITAICVMGAYSTSNNMFDVYFMLGAGVVGYLMKVSQIPSAPLLLTFVLAPMLEKYVRQSFDMTRGDISIFFRGGICWFFIIMTILMCTFPVLKSVWDKTKKSNSAAG
ncbi:tripartite tricarboxylate transporter permease [Lachnoclostridium edouardi]|uniref:tripartite tricarboxylate transporter permease n=1 Tax=Lachnoclostridium edouardi TaxID=1926283 RepID=UPI0015E11252|nr:tripartite tricarboxylate transporter permease [Lachnoclostridium edouardi]